MVILLYQQLLKLEDPLPLRVVLNLVLFKFPLVVLLVCHQDDVLRVQPESWICRLREDVTAKHMVVLIPKVDP